MKRTGHLWPAVIERGNLARAFHQAARGKRHKLEVQRFEQDLDASLERLRRDLEVRNNNPTNTNNNNGFRVARSSDQWGWISPA